MFHTRHINFLFNLQQQLQTQTGTSAMLLAKILNYTGKKITKKIFIYQEVLIKTERLQIETLCDNGISNSKLIT